MWHQGLLAMDQQPHSFDRIAPAPVNLARAPGNAGTPAAPVMRRGTVVPLLALGVLLCLALAVIFTIPHWQSAQRPTRAPEISSAAPQAQPAHAPESQPANTPGAPTDAEASAARTEAQNLLEQLRELDNGLKGIGVETWAGPAHRSAADRIAAGDRAYRSLDFPAARSAYQAALAELQALLKQSETVFSDAMAKGAQALNDGNAAAAGAAFSTALLIRPDDAAAVKGTERAGKLDQVMALIRQGKELARRGDLAAAANAFQQARDLDPESALAGESLQSARRELGARAYQEAMSAGFAALSAGDFAAARGRFAEALRLKPGAPEAADALRQAETRLTSVGIEQHLATVHAAEEAEDWGKAVAEYEATLKLDGNLLAARDGLTRAMARRDLDRQLAEVGARPKRLADDRVYEETRALLDRASTIPSPGARLKWQMAVLSTLLEEARIPVTVILNSDRETDVTVYRVGKLGRFTSKQVTLRPGRYVITGTRAGYRDVRVELTLSANAAPPPVQIQCVEPIAAVN